MLRRPSQVGVQLTPEFYFRRINERLSSPAQAAPETPRRPVRGDADLLKLADDPTFLSAAYSYYLKRSPDLEGFDHFHTALQNGEKRQTVLESLRRSAEAVYGVNTPVATPAVTAPGEVPEEWRLIYTPKQIELDELLLMSSAREFVEAAYRRILRRPPDGPGLEHHVDAVLRGIPREFILWRLCVSEEARSRPDTFLLRGRDATILSAATRLRARYRSMFPVRTYPALLAAARVEAAMLTLGAKLEAIERDRRAQAEAEGHAQRLALDTMAGRLIDLTSMLAEEGSRPQRKTKVEREYRAPAAIADAQRLEERSINILTKLDAIAGDIEARQIGLLRAVEANRASIGHVWNRVKEPVLPGGDGLVVTRSGGFVVSIPMEEWRLAISLGSGDDLEPGLVQYLRSVIQPGMVVVDVGANVGLLTLHAAERAGPEGAVFAFEPAPRTFTALQENLRANGFMDGRRLVARQAAIGERTGRAKLWTRPHNCGHDALFPESGDDQAIEVDVLALDDVLADEPRVDVIKIDAEGAEPLIWRGMQETLRRHPGITLLLEFAPGHLKRAGFAPEAFLDEMLAAGFRMQEVHAETGELRAVRKNELRDAFSVNLCLNRARQPEQGAAEERPRTERNFVRPRP